MELLLGGKAAEAAALYAELLASDPGDLASMEGRVRALITAGRWREALDEARRFASARPSSPRAQAIMGEALYRAGALAEARAVLELLVPALLPLHRSTAPPMAASPPPGVPVPSPPSVPVASPPPFVPGPSPLPSVSPSSPPPVPVASPPPFVPGPSPLPSISPSSPPPVPVASPPPFVPGPSPLPSMSGSSSPPVPGPALLPSVAAPAPQAVAGLGPPSIPAPSPPSVAAPLPPLVAGLPSSSVSEPSQPPIVAGLPSSSVSEPSQPPSRALLTLGLIRIAEDRDTEAADLLDRALAAAPLDRDVLFWAAGSAPTRTRAVALLEQYLALDAGDDPDRIEGARGTIRLYKALGEKPVWVPASRPQRVEAPLQALNGRDGRITGFVVELSDGSGRAIRVLLDSGSTGLFLLERIAGTSGFVPLAEETVFAGGAGGHQDSRRGLLPSIALGELRFTDALVSTTSEEIEPTGRYHGLLGLSIFQGYRITLDLSRGRLILERAGEQTGTASAASDDRPALPGSASSDPDAGGREPAAGAASGPAGGRAEPGTEPPAPGPDPRLTGRASPGSERASISTGTERAPTAAGAGSRIPGGSPADPAVGKLASSGGGTPTDPGNSAAVAYWTVSSQMLVEAATSDGRSGLFLFDTGASRSLLSLAFADAGAGAGAGGGGGASRVGEPTTVRGYGGPLGGARTVRGLRLRFQGLESLEPNLNAADLSQRCRLGGVEISGFLGLDLLNRTRVTIDTVGRHITVSKTAKR